MQLLKVYCYRLFEEVYFGPKKRNLKGEHVFLPFVWVLIFSKNLYCFKVNWSCFQTDFWQILSHSFSAWVGCILVIMFSPNNNVFMKNVNCVSSSETWVGYTSLCVPYKMFTCTYWLCSQRATGVSLQGHVLHIMCVNDASSHSYVKV